MAAEERVLCFKRELFEQLGVFQGLSLDVGKYLPLVTAAANTTYLNRSEAELDRRYKQLIPYVLIICNDRILRYRRGKGGGEKRLHGFYSVGIGGHISDVDIELFSNAGYQQGMRRELMEEVAIENDKDAAVAAINDDSTDVGYVHFGVVHVLSVPNEDVAGSRSGIVAPEFVPIAEAMKGGSEYETWSQFCLQNIDSLLARAAAAGIAVPERVAN
jgi:predicted NUDIX family phosphoesterase